MENYESSIIITGGTQGLGFHCARSIAKQCPTALVVIASRSDHNAAAQINKYNQQSNVKFIHLDLNSLVKVRDFVKQWGKQNHPLIQALVMNAGIQLPADIEYSEDGMEKHFAMHHVGHALLFHLLVPKLKTDARIVMTGSGVHDVDQKWPMKPDYTTPDEVAHPSPESQKKSLGTDRYATSKVANMLWFKALGRHCSTHSAHHQKTVVALCPGAMGGTSFMRHRDVITRNVNKYIGGMMVPLARAMIRENFHTAAESGENLAWLTVGTEVEGMKGVHFEARKEVEVSRQARDESLQEELWKWTVAKVSQGQEEMDKFERIE